jgi:hypothetical protein
LPASIVGLVNHSASINPPLECDETNFHVPIRSDPEIGFGLKLPDNDVAAEADVALQLNSTLVTYPVPDMVALGNWTNVLYAIPEITHSFAVNQKFAESESGRYLSFHAAASIS